MKEKNTRAIKGALSTSVPIFGAVFAEENRVKKFSTESIKFTSAVFLVLLFKIFMQNHKDMSSDNSSEANMSAFSFSMFLAMLGEMRLGAMLGELSANQFTKCCEEVKVDQAEQGSWRNHEISKNWLSAAPVVGPFFKTSKPKDMVHSATMDLAMYSLGAAAMTVSAGLFADSKLEEPISIVAMYFGMLLGMTSVTLMFLFAQKLFSAFNFGNNDSDSTYSGGELRSLI